MAQRELRNPNTERRAIAIRGVVQGVGFRPFVHGLASGLGLGGFVRNDAGSVQIEVEGDSPRVEQFLETLKRQPPPLARIDDVKWRSERPQGSRRFAIESSQSNGAAEIFICPDVATCDDCLRELCDAADRRFRYPFNNCTNCGPRLTIIQGAPYDRQRTTMSRFAMCPACQREYEDPTNRRFHAQPIACPICGPRVSLRDRDGSAIDCDDAITALADAMRSGQIAAIKGLGGYHLACDASNETAVAELRRRKHRDEKPFAVMAANLAKVGEICETDSLERELLTSSRRPIVLLRKREPTSIAKQVAPGNPHLGVMLPYTPLHHLLMAEMKGSPLVMTSGNLSDEPIAHEDADALERLHGIADIFLVHDRPIHVRCDDSVTRVVAGKESPLRRSRGYAPEPLKLPPESPQHLLAVGGQLKNTFALARGQNAFVSHHMGDLDHFAALRAFERDIELYQQLFAIEPAAIVHDLHPDYASTRYAKRREQQTGVRRIAVQHHHAHMASCMAEHGLEGNVIGISFDGTGYGLDGAIWGGEFLCGEYAGFERAAHFRYVQMPGGESAIHEPWRMALAHLRDAGLSLSPLERRIDHTALRVAERMLERNVNSPKTSSVGRLFDAVASIAGVRDTVSYEAQAAISLEWLASKNTEPGGYLFEIEAPSSAAGSMIIDTRPLIAAIAEDVARGTPSTVISVRFHAALVEIIVATCRIIRGRTKLNRVVLSGGVFMNRLLSEQASKRLSEQDFTVYRHERVPANDGGLSLGQLAVAAAQLINEKQE